MNALLWIVVSTLALSLISLVGVFTLSLRHSLLERILMFMVSLSAGALIGGAFLHLLPEALELAEAMNVFLLLIAGFSLFFFIEKVLHWQHCHKDHCEVHTFAYMNLIGDFIHNFIDGLIVASTFIINIPLGISTTVALALHEIPQEIGDFGVLLYGGFSKSRALLMNLLTGLSCVLGGIVGYFFSRYFESFSSLLLPIAAGGFIYIAASDLIPEIRKERNMTKTMINFGIFLLGILIMYLAAGH
ncbi:MAG: ZIP family metal transporter [Nanoarchaeota archaeon]|nr:ZIP family metal transporter [Nanoarchaeota archaeon]